MQSDQLFPACQIFLVLCYTVIHSMSLRWYVVSEQFNYTKNRVFHAILLPIIIEFSRCIGTYSSAKFELFIHSQEAGATFLSLIFCSAVLKNNLHPFCCISFSVSMVPSVMGRWQHSLLYMHYLLFYCTYCHRIICLRDSLCQVQQKVKVNIFTEEEQRIAIAEKTLLRYTLF
jgi:hypothetical protein